MEVSRQEIDRISIENEQATEMLESGRMHRHLPEMLRADIEFRDLSYCVPDGRKEEKAILRSVSGIFCSGQLSGILGPSGAGKSTLLNVLAGYRCVGETGLINVNGQPRVVRQFRKTSRYIMQEDAVQPFLTVMETMMIAAYLKLGGGIPYKQKREVIKEILTMLRLENSTRTTTCMLSGGERKRLSIALELLNNPAILFLDEPTTGLDETSSLQCMSLLKKIAEGGRTIICSIHTPSASIFSMFDHVYVMARGQCVYQGSRTNILPFLSSFGLHCPITYNIADFIIEVSGGEYGAEHVPKMVSAVNNGKVYKWEIASSSSVQEEFSQMEIMDKDADGEILHLCGNKGKQKKEDVFDTSVWLQFRVLTYRTFLQMLRNLNYLYLKLIMYIFLGIVVGMVFWNIGHDGSKTLYNFGYCYIVIVVCFYIPMLPMLTKFPMEVNLLKREYFNKWYSLNAYYLSVNISYIPLEMILSAIFCIVSYYMSDQPLELIRGIQFFIICMLVVMISLNFGMAISSTFNILNSSFLGPVLGTPLMLLAVHNLGIGSKGTPFIVRLIMHTSYLRFGVEGLTMSIYGRNRTKLFCPKTEDYCHFSYPQEIIKQVGMEDSSYWIAIVGLLVSFVAIQSIFYLLLRWRLSMKLKFPVVLHIERTIKMYLNMNR